MFEQAKDNRRVLFFIARDAPQIRERKNKLIGSIVVVGRPFRTYINFVQSNLNRMSNFFFIEYSFFP